MKIIEPVGLFGLAMKIILVFFVIFFRILEVLIDKFFVLAFTTFAPEA